MFDNVIIRSLTTLASIQKLCPLHWFLLSELIQIQVAFKLNMTHSLTNFFSILSQKNFV